jgi:hypothetical protein
LLDAAEAIRHLGIADMLVVALAALVVIADQPLSVPADEQPVLKPWRLPGTGCGTCPMTISTR